MWYGANFHRNISTTFNQDRYENAPFACYVMSSPTLSVTRTYIEWRQPEDWRQAIDIEAEYWQRNKKLNKEIYLSAGDAEPDMYMIPDINAFLEKMEKHRVKTIQIELYDGDHSSFVRLMLRNSLLEFYGV